ncbi:hypothetical protein A5724_07280 [Mycobacterium sp. ACS1612]|uniref:hypothetical protein n=1 Tax=Mycobacterium sp. ACS1612 TaxID=1834117 RepID=UPI0007FCC12C|nr:hypothetical protein [Mycobacterium sp. ACS1612]OBF40573.1 hypothetical protein A5724_07280 [Mycobacterium sp. ACS1612]
MVEREASGDFDYLWDDQVDAVESTGDDLAFHQDPAETPDDLLKGPVDDQWDEPDDNFWDNQPDVVDGDDRFDPFNDTTWSFKPAPIPWYRTKQAMTAIVAASAAMAAIVVSGVLLVFRGESGTATEVTSSVTPTAPTSVAPLQVASSEAPPPVAPPPPPAPPPETASPVSQAPRYEAPRVQPRPTKRPEINVTRSPLSVAPQPRGGR